ncbi:hypothetical protein KOW79_009210 [Hemibagrus wyckioides]|uniref:Uncharacterized protein n=1 Tax=Hemibagrus wyckioides TaxID=337641 RepID=A0A9D3SQ50_9TELE|nr:hypothetical protein KOW79_009210 [Hemibagrus wyckioides]
MQARLKSFLYSQQFLRQLNRVETIRNKNTYVHIWNGNIRSKACLSGIPQRNTVISLKMTFVQNMSADLYLDKQTGRILVFLFIVFYRSLLDVKGGQAYVIVVFHNKTSEESKCLTDKILPRNWT